MSSASAKPDPLVELVSAVLAGEISPAAGQERATGSDVISTISADHVAAISTTLADLAGRRADDSVLQAMRVVRTAAWASGDVQAATIGSMRLLTVIHSVLSYRHAGDLVHEAIDEHRRAVTMLRRDSTPAWCLGGIHSEFGRLVVDAYTRGGPRGDRRTIEERDRALRATAPALPQPAELLRSAADCLEKAAAAYPEHVDGDRAAALKARAEALEALVAMQVPLRAGEDPDTIVLEALEATPLEDVDVRAGLLLTLLAKGHTSPKIADSLLDLAGRSLNRERAVAAVVDTAQATGLQDPASGIRLLARAHPLLRECSPDLRESFLAVELALLDRLAPADSAQMDVVSLRAAAAVEGWTDPQRAAAFVVAAQESPATDGEVDGIGMVGEARAVGSEVVSGPALDYLEAILEQGAGVNAYRRKEWSQAARWYAESVTMFFELGLSERALNVLGMLTDVARHAGDNDRIPLLAALAPIVGRRELTAGTRGAILVQEAFRNLSASSDEPWNSEALWALRCLAKGARLASALRSGASATVSADEVASSLLARVDELTPADSAGSDTVVALDELTLVAYAGDDDPFPGDTTKQRLRNVRRRFDDRISVQLLRPTTGWAGIGDLQALLDDRTVVIDWYQGAMPDGNAALHPLVISRDRIEASIVPYTRDAGPVTFDLGGRTSTTSALAPDTWLRRLARERPLDEQDLVVPEAVEPLENAMEALFGSRAMAMLEGHRQAGRDHLCLMPHGSLHFDPVHLFGPVGRPLAEDWIVTTMPNSALLSLRRQRRRGDGIVSVGIESAFSDAYGLPPLKEARVEAEQVARSFAVDPLPEQQATPAVVLEAMSRARFVHLSTHGEQCPEAPSFHRVFLAPDSGSDGSLYAYEVLGADLRSVDLVTLSACESALGRFDVADNLGGLPAAFFLAGVRTIIGTLWRVSAAASKLFFGTLYDALASDQQPLEAFRLAQRQTRNAYPLYAQWGAFVFLGDWHWN